MKLHHLLQKCSFFLIKLAAFLASGAARMKLHDVAGAASAAKIICQGTRFARTLTYTMMRISDTIGDPDSVL